MAEEVRHGHGVMDGGGVEGENKRKVQSDFFRGHVNGEYHMREYRAYLICMETWTPILGMGGGAASGWRRRGTENICTFM